MASRFRGPRDRPRAAPDRPAARPEAVVVERHRPGSRRPAGLGQHARRNALAPAGHGPLSTAEQEAEIDLTATHGKLVEIEKQIRSATAKHNAFLKELGLPLLPGHG